MVALAAELGERGQRLLLVDMSPEPRATLAGAGLDQASFCNAKDLDNALDSAAGCR